MKGDTAQAVLGLALIIALGIVLVWLVFFTPESVIVETVASSSTVSEDGRVVSNGSSVSTHVTKVYIDGRVEREEIE